MWGSITKWKGWGGRPDGSPGTSSHEATRSLYSSSQSESLPSIVHAGGAVASPPTSPLHHHGTDGVGELPKDELQRTIADSLTTYFSGLGRLRFGEAQAALRRMEKFAAAASPGEDEAPHVTDDAGDAAGSIGLAEAGLHGAAAELGSLEVVLGDLIHCEELYYSMMFSSARWGRRKGLHALYVDVSASLSRGASDDEERANIIARVRSAALGYVAVRMELIHVYMTLGSSIQRSPDFVSLARKLFGLKARLDGLRSHPLLQVLLENAKAEVSTLLLLLEAHDCLAFYNYLDATVKLFGAKAELLNWRRAAAAREAAHPSSSAAVGAGHAASASMLRSGLSVLRMAATGSAPSSGRGLGSQSEQLSGSKLFSWLAALLEATTVLYMLVFRNLLQKYALPGLQEKGAIHSASLEARMDVAASKIEALHLLVMYEVEEATWNRPKSSDPARYAPVVHPVFTVSGYSLPLADRKPVWPSGIDSYPVVYCTGSPLSELLHSCLVSLVQSADAAQLLAQYRPVSASDLAPGLTLVVFRLSPTVFFAAILEGRSRKTDARSELQQIADALRCVHVLSLF